MKVDTEKLEEAMAKLPDPELVRAFLFSMKQDYPESFGETTIIHKVNCFEFRLSRRKRKDTQKTWEPYWVVNPRLKIEN